MKEGCERGGIEHVAGLLLPWRRDLGLEFLDEAAQGQRRQGLRQRGVPVGLEIELRDVGVLGQALDRRLQLA